MEAFERLLTGKHVISLVGGGGKTTLMFHLAKRMSTSGLRVGVMTTTKIGRPDTWCETVEACRACWNADEYALCGQAFGDEKLQAPPDVLVQALMEEADVLLVEADGAKGRPCKAPAEHEPVILPACDAVIGVMGMDAPGKPVEQVCYRIDHVCALLNCTPEHRLALEDLADLLLSAHGTRKCVGERTYIIALNQCDSYARVQAGKQLAELLHARGCDRVVLTGNLLENS